MMRTLLLSLTLLVMETSAQKTEIIFSVYLKDNLIGKIIATETKKGTDITRDIRSESDASVFAFTVHVETETKVIKGNEVLTEGTAFRHASRGAKDIHATTKRVSDKKYERVRNGERTLLEKKDLTFCVADLYFKEPIGLKEIYSNMFAAMIVIKDLGQGRYKTTNPENKSTYYTYKNGKLMAIESETVAGNILSKRN